ncbi:hypothetical protein F3Y22_tig00005465pilonHSYRG00151 [Hibiscus syriacus]|uniref:RING-type E3 ubiquitin transferase n=1 Tax=Hibiscus syriacus TaxID=106335 RepID=A0A6A3CF89_HIBSY|nr:hypothetical protein F3Y22_tig00005465pilonHSYRG00151 [Hibiscus syriacus]
MAFCYSLININHEYVSCPQHVRSTNPPRLLHLDIQMRYAPSLYPYITLQTFNCTAIGHHDMFLTTEITRDTIQSMIAESGATPEFIDTVLVPDILSYARHADSLPMDVLERQVMKLRVEILVEVDLDDLIESDELVDESLASSVNFTPASTSSIKELKRVKYRDDDDEDYIPLKKRRKLSQDSSSRKECVICLDEFSDQDEVTSMPCDHVYHYDCIVEWLKTSHLCPMCRYQMPIS